MTLVLALSVGVLFGAGAFLLLRRAVLRVVLGVVLLSHGANLLIFGVGGLTRAVPPIAGVGAKAPPTIHADPLPQALVLTAIVISFGVLAFLITLASRSCEAAESDDTDALEPENTEPETTEPEAEEDER